VLTGYQSFEPVLSCRAWNLPPWSVTACLSFIPLPQYDPLSLQFTDMPRENLFFDEFVVQPLRPTGCARTSRMNRFDSFQSDP